MGQFVAKVDGGKVVLEIQLEKDIQQPVQEIPTVSEPKSGAHSPDFRSYLWRGESFSFSPAQAKIVEALWKAREEGHRFLSTEILMDAAGSVGGTVKAIFGRHVAWKRFVLLASEIGGAPGTYLLADD